MLPLAKTVMAMRPADREAARRCRRWCWTGDDIDLAQAADPDLLAGRARAADHLAAGGHQGPVGDAREDDYNLGIYRMQVLGQDRTIMRWLAHRGGAQHHRRWKAEGKREPLPACAVIGADPGTILAAVTPVPDTLSEYQFAGLLRGAKVELVAGQDRAADGAGRGRDRASRATSCWTTTPTRGPTATTPATTIRSSSSRSSRSARSPCAGTRST